MVVITLYPLDKGYTIGLRTVTGKEFQVHSNHFMIIVLALTP